MLVPEAVLCAWPLPNVLRLLWPGQEQKALIFVTTEAKEKQGVLDSRPFQITKIAYFSYLVLGVLWEGQEGTFCRICTPAMSAVSETLREDLIVRNSPQMIPMSIPIENHWSEKGFWLLL